MLAHVHVKMLFPLPLQCCSVLYIPGPLSGLLGSAVFHILGTFMLHAQVFPRSPYICVCDFILPLYYMLLD